MSRVELEPAFLLHLRPYRDSSVLVEMLTRQHGRIGAIGKGARGSGRRSIRWRAYLQPFTPLLLSWLGRGELKTLTDLDAQPALALRGDALFGGFYVNELTLRLLHRNDPHPSLYDDYQHCIETLAGVEAGFSSAALEIALRRYEFALLDNLGYGISLDVEADSGDRVSAEGWYRFIPDSGLLRAMPGREPEPALFHGGDLLALAEGDFGPATLTAAKRLCRLALAPLLGNEPLRSRALFTSTRS